MIPLVLDGDRLVLADLGGRPFGDVDRRTLEALSSRYAAARGR